jgi:hypothetical protein
MADAQKKRFIKEVDSLLKLARALAIYGEFNEEEFTGDSEIRDLTILKARLGQLLLRLGYDQSSQHHISFMKFREEFESNSLHNNTYRSFYEIVGVLTAIKHDLKNGLLNKLSRLIQADIFIDFLDMSEHLLEEGYKDASAVIIGAVLEDTLRQIALNSEIAIQNEKGRKLTIDPLNIALAKNKVYGSLTQKEITSWADLRNNAAHGNFAAFDETQVRRMLQFVRSLAEQYLK